ncbi:unnamed protein product [Tetraodon nigroviridis]|uniref:(spotted green pufferfish) hypothetical protein n=1 Tax=Tetraodon nigroviridis TaxID=99883 RepID=Q4T535_TETNG|nr:unnamed protein product [Tetraodon nigroviridis]
MRSFILYLLSFFRESRGKFFVYVASETKNAHKEWISFFKRLGYAEVDNAEDADYLLVFCPVKSRIKTDIDEALEKIPDGKAAILVVMHHTFNRNLTIMESRQQVTRADVSLTVDCLFHEGKLLRCAINQAARDQIQDWLGLPPNPVVAVFSDIVFKVFYWLNWFYQWVLASVKKITKTIVNLVTSFFRYLYGGLRWFVGKLCHILGIRRDRSR